MCDPAYRVIFQQAVYNKDVLPCPILGAMIYSSAIAHKYSIIIV